MSIKIAEQFYTIQGEGKDIGKPAYFIRLVGCFLRCKFCDSKHSWVGENTLPFLSDIKPFNITGKYIVLTGGEPMMHIDKPELKEFVDKLSGYEINVETTGIRENTIYDGNVIDNVLDFISKIGNGKNTMSFVVSPKLDARCYTNEVTSRDIFNFYRVPIDGINWILQKEIERLITYKFIYTPETEDTLNFMLQTIPEWFRNNVYIMPMTTIKNFTN
ncbi:MAG: 7-carboxy-7-deazaguanine synthase QueE, partial [Candidatus Peribacteraceae bacterium]|nr:7-carboxy-7-deazaguanine synthase QueE [Candidatus Peribacteraceae bacterium]